MSTFSENLIKLKEEQKLLQKDVAEKICVPLRTYQRYERGEREPSIDTLVKLANLFNISTDELLGRHSTDYFIDKCFDDIFDMVNIFLSENGKTPLSETYSIMKEFAEKSGFRHFPSVKEFNLPVLQKIIKEVRFDGEKIFLEFY